MAFFQVRKTRYGKAAYHVVQVVKETAATHSFIELDYKGEWGRRPTLVRENAPATGRFETLTEAEALCALVNAAWDSQTQAVDDAKAAYSAAVEARRFNAHAVLASGSAS